MQTGPSGVQPNTLPFLPKISTNLNSSSPAPDNHPNSDEGTCAEDLSDVQLSGHSPQSHRMSQRLSLLTPFHGLKNGREDPTEFIESVEFEVNQGEFKTLNKVQQAARVIFRAHLRDKALEWYQDLPSEVRNSTATSLCQLLLLQEGGNPCRPVRRR